MGALRLHSVALGAPLHRSPGPAQRKGWSVIAPHRGDECVVRDMPFDGNDAGANFGKGWSVRGLRFGRPPQVGASLAMLRHNVIGTSQHRQLPIAMALPGK
jgi:hypothetical protein